MRNVAAVIASAVLAAAGFGFTMGAWAFGDDERPNTPVVFEDGSGTLPPGSTNPVLGDVSGRVFCLAGELCEED